jgi:hypothetical protein
MKQQWGDIVRGKPKDSEKTCPSATVSTTNPVGLIWARTTVYTWHTNFLLPILLSAVTIIIIIIIIGCYEETWADQL